MIGSNIGQVNFQPESENPGQESSVLTENETKGIIGTMCAVYDKIIKKKDFCSSSTIIYNYLHNVRM